MTSTTLPPADMISVNELVQLQRTDANVCVLDVRTGSEYSNSHIEGSYHVPLDTLGEHTHDLASVDRPIILVCQSGGRAATAHQKLSEAGHGRLHILEGGMNAWELAGGKVITATNQKWAMDRQVRFVAGSFVLAGILASLKFPKAKFFAGAVGGGLFYSAVSNTCMMANVLAKLPYNRTDTNDVADVVRQLRSTQ